MAVEINRYETPVTPASQFRGPTFNRVETTRDQSALPFAGTYVMRGMDHNVNGLYDTWEVTGGADFAALSYAGALSTPLRDVVVQSHSS
jgi:hypothetical protein